MNNTVKINLKFFGKIHGKILSLNLIYKEMRNSNRYIIIRVIEQIAKIFPQRSTECSKKLSILHNF